MTFLDIELLVPHRRTMLRLDILTNYNKTSSEGFFVVKDGDPFVRDGYLREESIIETLAQTVAAGQGYPAAQAGKSLGIGYLTGVESVKYYRKIMVGEKIETKVKLLSATGPLRLMQCHAFSKGELLVEGILKFYVPKIEG